MTLFYKNKSKFIEKRHKYCYYINIEGEMERKKRNIILPFLIIIIILLLGTTGYLVYDKYNTKDDTKEENSNEQSISLEITEDLMNTTMNLFNSPYTSVQLHGYFYKINKQLVKKMDEDALLNMAIYKAKIAKFKNESIKYDGETKYYFDQDEIDAIAIELFGENVKLNHKTITVDAETYIFNNSDKRYEIVYLGGKGGPTSSIYTKLYKVEKTDDTVSIIIRFAYLKMEEIENITASDDELYEYKVYNSMNAIKENYIDSIELHSCTNCSIGIGYANENKLPQYKFTYKLNNGNTIFYSVEKIN